VNRILRAALVSSMFLSSMALAQEVEMNMDVQVDEDGNTNGASIKIKGTDGADMPSGGVQMRVKVRGPAQPQQQPQRQEPPPPPPMRQPPPPPPPPPAQAARDCGTGNDPGCTMMRDGKYPMDGATWSGFYTSLKAQKNEISRQEMAEKMLKRSYITAAQYSLLLDLFMNEISRLELAKSSAPHVVNPQHALGFSTKWQNSISAEEYSEMISEQQP
jgi:hypothetical protein